MTIETKYQAGDLVWLINQNKIKTAIIRILQIDQRVLPANNMSVVKIMYNLESMGTGFIEECMLFKTKEGLLNSL
jgi:hypothetical protein